MEHDPFWNDTDGKTVTVAEGLRLFTSGWHLTVTKHAKGRDTRIRVSYNLHPKLEEAKKLQFKDRLNYALPKAIGSKLMKSTEIHSEGFRCSSYNGHTFVVHTYAHGPSTLEQIRGELGDMIRGLSYIRRLRL